jgi:hypothetical protein
LLDHLVVILLGVNFLAVLGKDRLKRGLVKKYVPRIRCLKMWPV